MSYSPPYSPRPGSKVATACSAIAKSGGMACTPLSQILACDPRNVRNMLQAPIQRGYLQEEHRSGLLFFVLSPSSAPPGEDVIVDEHGAAQPSGGGPDVFSLPAEEPEQAVDELGAVSPASEDRPADPNDFVSAGRDADQFAWGVFRDGRMVLLLGDSEVQLSPSQTRSLQRALAEVVIAPTGSSDA